MFDILEVTSNIQPFICQSGAIKTKGKETFNSYLLINDVEFIKVRFYHKLWYLLLQVHETNTNIKIPNQ